MALRAYDTLLRLSFATRVVMVRTGHRARGGVMITGHRVGLQVENDAESTKALEKAVDKPWTTTADF